MPADLLKIGELADFHTITPDFPAKPPRAKRRAFPIVLHKSDVMHLHIDANCLKRAKIKRLKVGWARFDHDLILIVMLQAVRVLAVAPIRGAARGLHICRCPGFRAKRA